MKNNKITLFSLLIMYLQKEDNSQGQILRDSWLSDGDLWVGGPPYL